MKTLKLLSLLSLILLFSRCGTIEPTGGATSASITEAAIILDTTASVFLRNANQTGGNPAMAMEMTMWYLREEPSVSNVYVIDSSLLEIELSSGLKVAFRFIATDDAGNAIYRGGSDFANADILESSLYDQPMPLANHIITNKKVLFFASDTKSLPQVDIQLNKWVDILSKSDLDLEVTVTKDAECSEEVVRSFKDYGLVIMDTHGLEDGFLTGVTITASLLKGDGNTAQAAVNAKYPGLYARLLSGELKLGSQINANPKTIGWEKSATPSEARDVFCTAKYIRGLPEMPNTIIFGNMCYSGWITPTYVIPGSKWRTRAGEIKTSPDRTITVDPIGKAFIDRGPLSYYGFTRDLPYPGTSRAVPDDFAGKVESAFLERLVNSRDSTEIAHRDKTKNAEYFDPEHKDYWLLGLLNLRQYGKKDYSYSGCVSEFTDDRDGEKYKAVCIGKQNWMAENLRYNASGSDLNPNVDAQKYGRFYDHTTVMNGAASSTTNPSGVKGICPKGWHLPSLSEWIQLSDFAGGENISGGHLKAISTDWSSPNKGATDKYGFSGLPGGLYYADSSTYYFTGNEGDWWATDDGTKKPDTHSGISLLYYGTTFLYGTDANTDPGNKKNCRCLKD